MRWCFTLLWLLVSACGRSSAPAESADEPPPVVHAAVPEPQSLDDVEPFVDGVVAGLMERDHVPGVVIAIVHEGNVLMLKGYGVDDMETLRPMDPQRSLVRVASISKTFVWTAVAQLIERGQMSLDDDVNQHLEAFKIPEAFGAPIQIRHIMTHTTGFEDQPRFIRYDDADEVPQLEDHLRDNIPARVRAPGTMGSYSNYAASLAGYIVEQVSGMSFAEYVEANITGPVGMTRTTLREPIGDTEESMAAELRDDLVQGGVWKAGKHATVGEVYLRHIGPASSMRSTADDMMKWLRVWLGDGSLGGVEVLAAETAREMHSPLFRHHEAVGGYGWGLRFGETSGHRFYGHGGSLAKTRSTFLVFPQLQLGIFAHVNGPPAPTRGRIVERILERYFPVPQTVPNGTPPGKKELAKYAGRWVPLRRNFSSVQALSQMLYPEVATHVVDDGVLGFRFRRAAARWRWIGDHQFQREGGHEILAFAVKGDQAVHLFSGSKAMERPSVWRSSRAFRYVQVALLGLSALTLLASGAALRYRDPNPGKLGLARWLRLGCAATWLLIFTFAAASHRAPPPEQAQHWIGWPPPSLQAAVWLLHLNALITLALLATLPKAMRAEVHWRFKTTHGLFILASVCGCLLLGVAANGFGFRY